MRLPFLGCLRRLFIVALLLVLAGAAFIYRDRVMTVWNDVRSRFGGVQAERVAVASAELAEAADAKLDALGAGESDRAAFSGLELQSLIEYRYRQLLPAFVDSPRVDIDDGRVRLRVRVPLERIPRSSELDEIAGLLPDTTDLAVHGQLIPMNGGGVAFAVDQLSAHRIPLPSRFVPGALEMLGRKDEPGLPRDAIGIPLPRGARAAYVRGDSLVLLSGTAQPRN